MTQSKLTIDNCGNKEWRNQDGRYHREDGPAVEYANENKEWRMNGFRNMLMVIKLGILMEKESILKQNLKK